MDTMNIHFLMDEDGISVLPVTSLLLEHEASNNMSRPELKV